MMSPVPGGVELHALEIEQAAILENKTFYKFGNKGI